MQAVPILKTGRHGPFKAFNSRLEVALPGMGTGRIVRPAGRQTGVYGHGGIKMVDSLYIITAPCKKSEPGYNGPLGFAD